MSTKSLICYGVIGFIGVILIVVSMAGFAYFPALIESQIFKTLDITDHESEGYKNFIQPPVPIYMAFNMFHVNNPEAIKNGLEKPSLTEIGPFVYQEFREKRNVNISEDGCSVKAEQYKMYKFDLEKTRQLCPTCGDATKRNLTMINAAYVGTLQLIREGFLKDLANTPCIPIVGCLSDQVKENIDRISCVVDKDINKWSDKLILNRGDATYPNCEIGTNSTEWEKYIDDLFIEVTVDDFLFKGYKSGVLHLLQEQMIENWGLNDTVSTQMKLLNKVFGWNYPLVRLPSVIQPGEDGEFRFAALNSKNGTSHNEHYEIDTGKCGPKPIDNWWLDDPEASDNDMINYMQIKQWGPEADNINYIIDQDVVCHDGEESCFAHPTEGNPFGDFGWWTQNNGLRCWMNDSSTTTTTTTAPTTTTTTTTTTTMNNPTVLHGDNKTSAIIHRDYCQTNDTDETEYLNNNICNWPRGTDGQQFHPYIKKNDRLWIFQTDICRSLYMDYVDEVNFMGFETYKFAVPKEALKMETEYNLGYCKEIQRGKIVDCGGIINPQKCLEEVDWDSCVKIENDAIKPNPEDTYIDISACKEDPAYDESHDCYDGIMDISKCMEGAAVTISSPHFYQSDPGFRKKFDGISDPDLTPERYETYMLVEKYTGAALSLHKRLQFNIPLHKDSHSAFMTDLIEDHYLFPMFWIEEFADLDLDYKEKLDDMLTKPLRLVDAAQWTMFAVGVMLVILMLILFIVHFCCRSERHTV